MKQSLITTAKVIAVIAAFAIVAQTVSAWTQPGGAFPSGNVPAPVNTGSVAQTKTSSFSTTVNLNATQGNVNGLRGFFSSVVNAPRARFGCFLFCSDIATNSVLVAGQYINNEFQKGLVITDQGLPVAQKVPFWVNLSGLTGVPGRNILVALVSSDNVSHDAGAAVITNANKLSFWNLAGSDLVGLAAKRIRLTEGAGAGKILTSDATGNASWQDGFGDSVTTDGLIRYVRRTSTGTSNMMAFCGANDPSDDQNWIVVGGGGDCEYGMQISQPVTNRSGSPHPNGESTSAIGWRLDCLDAGAKAGAGTVITDGGSGGDAHAEVICMRKAPLVLAGELSTTPSAPADDRTWHTITKAQGNLGQSCANWLGSNYDGNPSTVRLTGEYVQNGSFAFVDTGNCAYKYDVPTSGTAVGGFAYVSYCVMNAPTWTNPGARPVATCNDPALGGNINDAPNHQTPYGENVTKTELYY